MIWSRSTSTSFHGYCILSIEGLASSELILLVQSWPSFFRVLNLCLTIFSCPRSLFNKLLFLVSIDVWPSFSSSPDHLPFMVFAYFSVDPSLILVHRFISKPQGSKSSKTNSKIVRWFGYSFIFVFSEYIFDPSRPVLHSMKTNKQTESVLKVIQLQVQLASNLFIKANCRECIRFIRYHVQSRMIPK